MALTTDVLVIGAGIIGCGIAYELAKAGVRVVVAERGEIGRESSWAGAGVCIAQRPDSDPLSPLRRISQQLYPQWVAELQKQTGIDAEWRQCGRLMLLDDESEWQRWRTVVERLREQGVTVSLLSADEVRRCEPAVTPETIGAVLWHEDAQVRNPRLVRALAVAAMQRGVVFLTHSPVIRLQPAENHVEAMAGAEQVSAGAAVIAAGCWSGEIGALLGLDVPVMPARGQMVLLDALAVPLRSIVEWGGFYCVPRSDGRVLVGATVEFVGYDKRTTAAGVTALLAAAQRAVPALRQATFVTAWAGLRPYAERPLLGRLTETVFMATGHFRVGIQMAPGTAVTLRDLILFGHSPLLRQ